MKSIKSTNLYNDVLLEISYPFGDLFIFDGFVISEINEGITFNWEHHAKTICKDVFDFLGSNGEELVYISNRINSYSVMATDWLKFFNNSYCLKGYYVVSNSKLSGLTSMIENLFFTSKIVRFNSIEEAVNMARQTNLVFAEF